MQITKTKGKQQAVGAGAGDHVSGPQHTADAVRQGDEAGCPQRPAPQPWRPGEQNAATTTTSIHLHLKQLQAR